MRVISLLLALWLAACATARFDPMGEDDASYARAHPYFAEFCALSQIKKRDGFGAEILGGIGGHSVFYLQGACRDEGSAFPVLVLCEGDGAGLSMNAHFRNAKWVAVPGHRFFFEGDLPPNTAVTPASYKAVQQEAQQLGIYRGVDFHDEVFDDMPPGWSRADWKYEMSVGTDYAVSLARGRYCARVPVTRAEMAKMISFLNAENAPYRAGAVFRWNVFTDNCIHLAHNALAAAGFWDRWPTHMPLLIAMLDFPVPRNEFINLMRRENEALPADPGQVYDDPAARDMLLSEDLLPTRPGALALARPVDQPNALYRNDVQLIFYDEPMFGSYQSWSDRILSEPRFVQPAANQAYFAAMAHHALDARRPLGSWFTVARYRTDAARFSAVYDRYYALMSRLAALP